MTEVLTILLVVTICTTDGFTVLVVKVCRFRADVVTVLVVTFRKYTADAVTVLVINNLLIQDECVLSGGRHYLRTYNGCALHYCIGNHRLQKYAQCAGNQIRHLHSGCMKFCLQSRSSMHNGHVLCQYTSITYSQVVVTREVGIHIERTKSSV